MLMTQYSILSNSHMNQAAANPDPEDRSSRKEDNGFPLPVLLT